MFDIGFWELAVIMVVALLVIGPERLPGLARTLGLYVGKARRFVSSVKADINRELKAEELKRILQEHQDATGLHEIIEETKETLHEARQEYLVKSKDPLDKQDNTNQGSAKKSDTDDGAG